MAQTPNIIDVTDSTFETEVVARSRQTPVVVALIWKWILQVMVSAA